jgi:hypothetical protein
MYERTRARAAAGAGLLDRIVPFWWRRIKIRPLDISDCRNCLTGQLFGDYDRGLDRLGLSHDEARHYGFEHNEGDVGGYYTLTDAWKDEVRRRRRDPEIGRRP